MTTPTLLNLSDSVNRDLQDICEAWSKDREFVITSLIGRLKRGEWGPDGWQPIATAPKDGTRFLFTNGTRVGIGFYLNGKHFAADSWGGETNTIASHWQAAPPPENP